MANPTTGVERILTLYFPYHIDPKLGIEDYIIYRGKKVTVSPEEIDEVTTSLGEYWHSSRDRLIHFSINSDGSYFCERKKDIYNFYTKETDTKVYDFDTAAAENVREATASILAFFETKQLESITNLQDEFVRQFKGLNFYSAHLLEMRQIFLRESDYMFTSDYPMDADKKALWQTFRQELRDITAQQAWIDGDYLNVSFPVSPENKEQAERMMAVARASGLISTSATQFANVRVTSDFIREYGKLLVKMRMVSVLGGLGLPSMKEVLGFGMPEFHLNEELTKIYGDNIPFPVGGCPIESGALSVEQYIDELNRVNIVERLDDYVLKIEETIQKIDPNLTIGDVWSLAKDYVTVNDEVDDLLSDLEGREE